MWGSYFGLEEFGILLSESSQRFQRSAENSNPQHHEKISVGRPVEKEKSLALLSVDMPLSTSSLSFFAANLKRKALYFHFEISLFGSLEGAMPGYPTANLFEEITN
ncbi:MAG: hypothetical protein GY821_10465 [Gammaproteobacteria bacterium]|nr:hypothetical protein [Gammaproteobacteria bacterium]